MDIDEAIELLNSIVKVNKHFLQGIENQTINQKEIQAIETIINEYQDLKDLSNELQIRYTIENMKYKDLKEIEEAHRIENGDLREKLKQLEEIDKHIPRID